MTAWLLALSLTLSLLLNSLGWAASLALTTDKLYDAVGAVSFLLVNIVAFLLADPTARGDARPMLATLTIMAWAARLGAFLLARVLGHSDRRLTPYLRDPVGFLAIFFAQSLWVFFSSLPVLALHASAGRARIGGAWDAAALCTCWAAALLQVVADEQKRAFRAVPANRGKFITSGLWAVSRHPNYAAQMVTAWALAAFCLPGLVAGCGVVAGGLAALGPLLETALLLRVSGVPLLERAAQDKWGDDPRYRAYVAATPVLWPRVCAARR